MGDLNWTKRGYATLPLHILLHHLVLLGASGTGKTETEHRLAYGARKVHRIQVFYLDAKGETKRNEEEAEDNAARFYATMKAAGAEHIAVFPSQHLNGWMGTPTDLKNRLLSVIDTSESAYYGDVAANALDLALNAPTTPRSSDHFLANLRYERLKAIYQQHDPAQHQRVLRLDQELLKQVEMRYQVFFRAMDGMLDGTLDYSDADAVYLRVKGFTLRNQAPRLGRFLILDFMHYLAERKKSGTVTLLIIDEFNALRMGEEASLLFEQCRSFGGCLAISAQGYAGLGPRDVANRILDACSTYVLHACSDPFEVSRRAGKRFFLETTYTEDADGNATKHIRPKYDWKVPEDVVIQQDTGQAFYIYRGKFEHVQTARVIQPKEEIADAWKAIREMEAKQQQETQQRIQNARKPQAAVAPVSPQKKKTATTNTAKPKSAPATPQIPPAQSPVPTQQQPPKKIPLIDPDDNEPDEL